MTRNNERHQCSPFQKNMHSETFTNVGESLIFIMNVNTVNIKWKVLAVHMVHRIELLPTVNTLRENICAIFIAIHMMHVHI